MHFGETLHANMYNVQGTPQMPFPMRLRVFTEEEEESNLLGVIEVNNVQTIGELRHIIRTKLGHKQAFSLFNGSTLLGPRFSRQRVVDVFNLAGDNVAVVKGKKKKSSLSRASSKDSVKSEDSVNLDKVLASKKKIGGERRTLKVVSAEGVSSYETPEMFPQAMSQVDYRPQAQSQQQQQQQQQQQVLQHNTRYDQQGMMHAQPPYEHQQQQQGRPYTLQGGPETHHLSIDASRDIQYNNGPQSMSNSISGSSGYVSKDSTPMDMGDMGWVCRCCQRQGLQPYRDDLCHTCFETISHAPPMMENSFASNSSPRLDVYNSEMQSHSGMSVQHESYTAYSGSPQLQQRQLSAGQHLQQQQHQPIQHQSQPQQQQQMGIRIQSQQGSHPSMEMSQPPQMGMAMQQYSNHPEMQHVPRSQQQPVQMNYQQQQQQQQPQQHFHQSSQQPQQQTQVQQSPAFSQSAPQQGSSGFPLREDEITAFVSILRSDIPLSEQARLKQIIRGQARHLSIPQRKAFIERHLQDSNHPLYSKLVAAVSSYPHIPVQSHLRKLMNTSFQQQQQQQQPQPQPQQAHQQHPYVHRSASPMGQQQQQQQQQVPFQPPPHGGGTVDHDALAHKFQRPPNLVLRTSNSMPSMNQLLEFDQWSNPSSPLSTGGSNSRPRTPKRSTSGVTIVQNSGNTDQKGSPKRRLSSRRLGVKREDDGDCSPMSDMGTYEHNHSGFHSAEISSERAPRLEVHECLSDSEGSYRLRRKGVHKQSSRHRKSTSSQFRPVSDASNASMDASSHRTSVYSSFMGLSEDNSNNTTPMSRRHNRDSSMQSRSSLGLQLSQSNQSSFADLEDNYGHDSPASVGSLNLSSLQMNNTFDTPMNTSSSMMMNHSDLPSSLTPINNSNSNFNSNLMEFDSLLDPPFLDDSTFLETMQEISDIPIGTLPKPNGDDLVDDLM